MVACVTDEYKEGNDTEQFNYLHVILIWIKNIDVILCSLLAEMVQADHLTMLKIFFFCQVSLHIISIIVFLLLVELKQSGESLPVETFFLWTRENTDGCCCYFIF